MKHIAIILTLASSSILAHADQQAADDNVSLSRDCAIAIMVTIEDFANHSEQPLISNFEQLECIESADKIVVQVLPKSAQARGGGRTYKLHPRTKEIIAKIPQRWPDHRESAVGVEAEISVARSTILTHHY